MSLKYRIFELWNLFLFEFCCTHNSNWKDLQFCMFFSNFARFSTFDTKNPISYTSNFGQAMKVFSDTRFQHQCIFSHTLPIHDWSTIPEFYYLMCFVNITLKLCLNCSEIIPVLLSFCFWSCFVTFFLLIRCSFIKNYSCRKQQ